MYPMTKFQAFNYFFGFYFTDRWVSWLEI